MTGQASFLFSGRFLVTVMCFWSVANMMYLRINMSVAIVCMVNQTRADSASGSTNSSSSADSFNYTTANRSRHHELLEDGSVKWDSLTQGQVLGSYYYGYAAIKIPIGWVVHHVGGWKLIFASSVAATTASLLIPIVALHSATAIVFLRVLLGICGGVLLPAVQAVLKNWSPLSERSRMGGYTFAGFPCGTLAAFIFSGLLCEYGFAGGWPSVFYTFGTRQTYSEDYPFSEARHNSLHDLLTDIFSCISSGICSLVFSLLWLVAVSETPQTHLCMRRSEKNYIQANLGAAGSDHKPHSVPWRSILTSPPVYAVIACAVSNDFVGNVFLLYLPTYLADVMNFNIASSGLLSALPYVFCFLTLTLGGHLSDYLIKHTQLRTGTVRKLTSGSGMIMCIVSLICISFMNSDQADVAVALLVLSVAGIGLMTIGYFVNPMDIAPQHAGVIVAIASTAGDIAGFISPVVVAAITAQGSLQQSWQIVFLMSAGVVAVCLIIYLIFASGDVQPWALSSQEDRRIQSLLNNESVVNIEITSSSKHFNVGDEEDGSSSQALLPQKP